ncbi:hypothetical protein L6465_04500 [Prevotella sp. E2-28]|nr:hypothetical protein [Prevotella sp. E2-28]UKK54521.1 hypothetical protein L6465_04500 [Prevotella sp. E2-28]
MLRSQKILTATPSNSIGGSSKRLAPPNSLLIMLIRALSMFTSLMMHKDRRYTSSAK